MSFLSELDKDFEVDKRKDGLEEMSYGGEFGRDLVVL